MLGIESVAIQESTIVVRSIDCDTEIVDPASESDLSAGFLGRFPSV